VYLNWFTAAYYRIYMQLQNNRLMSLPDSFADFTSLVNLDLSHNALTSLPPHFFALPALSNLDISHKSLVALPFGLLFDPATKVPAPSRRSSDFFLAPAIVRATCPLPRLASLDASHNKIVASAIHRDALPLDLRTFNLTYNPLGDVAELLISLSALTQLVELRMSKCNIDDTSFPASLLSSATAQTFIKLAVLDLGETLVTQAAVSSAFSTLVQSLDFEAPIGDARAVAMGTLAVAVGKRIVREAWEIEADRHVQRLREKRSAANLCGTSAPAPPQSPLQPVAREQGEIDEEHGFLSEGAIRRARAEATQHTAEETGVDILATASPHTPPALEHYWDIRTLTLTLPPSSGRPVRRGVGAAAEKEMLPRATLPLTLITTQPFADTLRSLDLRGRRAEPAFILPSCSNGSFLPRLEMLNLEGCSLSDAVSGAESANGGTICVLAQLFPSLRNLELAYNNLTGAAVARGLLEQLLFVGNGGRAGLRRLGLCGNKIEELDGLRELAQVVFNAEARNEDAGIRSRWTLEELDIRENSIAALPGELGLLPLDLFLVDGNL
jgi:Leucine rich repeat